ncbi:MAG: endogenous inhibitor of DNA gyrase (YacG/DUF329 family) [Myxococcota bacterium]
MRCPICKTELSLVEEKGFKPFCSARCRYVDLGKWLGGEYAIAGRSVQVDSDAPLVHIDDIGDLDDTDNG